VALSSNARTMVVRAPGYKNFILYVEVHHMGNDDKTGLGSATTSTEMIHLDILWILPLKAML
jgi:hypothetical protein